MTPTQCKWNIGAHTQFDGSLARVIETSAKHDMTVTQFFYGSPKGYSRCKPNASDMTAAQKLLKKTPMFTASHYPYIANLAGSMEQVAWGRDGEGTAESQEAQNTKTLKVLTGLQYELSQLAILNPGQCGVVVHPGNFKNRSRGLQAISETIDKIEWTPGGLLLLENSAGQGSVLATTFTELATIINGCSDESKEHIGICVDTAHIWGVGDYDISKVDEVDRMFDEFDRDIGLDRWKLLHLNDSSVPIGAKKDRHARISTGSIWYDSPHSLIHLLNRCKELGIPAVLETHRIDMLYLRHLEIESNGTE